jgi:glycosyltransferase involved in cell wall biosynthesis
MNSILIFESGSSGYGGSFKSCYFITNILKEYGYSPYVAYVYDSIYWEKLQKKGIEVKNLYTNPFYKNIDRFSKKINRIFPYYSIYIDSLLHSNFINDLKKFISEKNITLVHTNTHFISDFLMYKSAVSLKLPIICHLRSMPRRYLTIPEQKLAGYKYSCFIAISNAVLKEWVKAGIPEHKIKLIYDAQPQIKNTSSYKKHSSKDDSTTHLLYVGRLKKHKGVNILIKALAILESKKWKLSIVGDGPEMKNLKRLSKKMGLEKEITFFGFQESVEKFYRSHDILIVPSLKEEFGLVIIEAMQFGVTVIGSNKGGIPEIIENGKDGLLFESQNVKSLSEVIEYLINDPDKRIQIGLNGREKVNNIFTEKYFTEKLIETYEEVLKYYSTTLCENLEMSAKI